MGRKPCCSKEEGLNRGAWTAAEDKILKDYIEIHGEGKWRTLPKKAGLRRCGKSCRLRWLNYLRPDIKRGNITHDEEELIIRLHKLLGNRWSLIAGRLPGRTDNEIKNYWNTTIGKKLQDHQSPSSSSRKPLCVFQEKPKFISRKSIAQPSKAHTDSFPIRTKAFKCTKVFISTPEPQKYDHQNQVPDTKQVTVASSSIADGLVDDDNQNVKGPESVPEFNLEENDPSDFMRDFEMDEHLLSLLSTDFSQLANFDDTIGGDSSTANTCDKGYSSPTSDETLLLSEDNNLHYMDFLTMDSLIGFEFEWLRESK